MSTVPPHMRELARRLLASELSRAPGSPGSPCCAVLVCEKWKACLTRLGGLSGFRSLLSRALALAKVEADSLETVMVLQDGTLSGFGKATPAAPQAEEALVATLLSLLVTFIGEPLTRQLVAEAWPDVPGLGSTATPEISNGEQNEP